MCLELPPCAGIAWLLPACYFADRTGWEARVSPPGKWGDKPSATSVGPGHLLNIKKSPITSFEDWIHGLKVAHHLHQAGLPSDGIYQWAMVVPWLQDSGIQSVIVLHPVGYDELTPCVFSALLGISVTELQGGSAYTTVPVCPCRTVLSVKMIRLGAFDVSGGIHQTIGKVHWDGHNAAEIVHKEAIGTPLASIAPGPESIVHLPEVDIYVLDDVVDLAGAV